MKSTLFLGNNALYLLEYGNPNIRRSANLLLHPEKDTGVLRDHVTERKIISGLGNERRRYAPDVERRDSAKCTR